MLYILLLKGEDKMKFSTEDKPKILRTRLSEETLRDFKALAAKKDITMVDYIEKLIKDEIEKEG